MFETPVVLLWAFATCVATVMMATLVRRRREQLTQQLRDHVGRHLNPDETAGQAAAVDEAADPPRGDPDPIE